MFVSELGELERKWIGWKRSRFARDDEPHPSLESLGIIFAFESRHYHSKARREQPSTCRFYESNIIFDLFILSGLVEIHTSYSNPTILWPSRRIHSKEKFPIIPQPCGRGRNPIHRLPTERQKEKRTLSHRIAGGSQTKGSRK